MNGQKKDMEDEIAIKICDITPAQSHHCMLCKGNTNDLLLFASIGDKITGTSTTQCVSQLGLSSAQADSLV